jgi:hypothetical protein
MDDRLLPQGAAAAAGRRRLWPWALAGVLLLAGALLAAWLGGWLADTGPTAPPVVADAPPAAAPAPAPAPSAPPIAHPVVEVAEAPDAPDAPSLTAALEALYGRQLLMTMFQLDGFAARVVATVDNLGREHAAPRNWPLVPVPGRFAVEARGGSQVVAAANAGRYAPYLRLMEQVPPARLAALYRAHYARFQQAYEDLGYPGRYFNDRLVQVIDALLATPRPASPPGLHLPVIQGPVQPPRPWVMHAFDDDALQALPAGQRLLLRLAPAQRARVEAWLQALRREVAAQPASDSTRSR